MEREGLEDEAGPSTRFVVLRSRCPAPTGRDRSFFVVTPRRDEPGSLVRLLQEFSVRGINLTTIESRPTRALLGEYRFLIECEGHVADAHVRDAVLGLLRFPGETRFLGSFPEDPARRGPRARARAAAGGRAGLRADAGAGRGVKAGVVGLGLIGGSLLRALGGVGYDADPGVRAAAAAEGFEVADSLAGLGGLRAGARGRAAGAHRRRGGRGARRAPGRARRRHRLGQGRAAAPASASSAPTRWRARRPRAGRASSAELLAGAPWAVCPAGEALEPLLALGAAVEALGGRLVACTPEEHDAAVARTSHVPHVAAQALAGLAAEGGLQAALAGTAFRDMTRVARADAGLWAEILSANREPCIAAIDELVARLGVLRTALGDDEATRAEWALGLEWLDAVDAVRWREPDWREEPVDGWAGLLAHGREGRAVRRLRRVRDGAPARGGGAMRRRFDPSGPLRGTLAAPSDKSLSHRAALLAAMASDPVRVTGYLDAEDTNSTLAAVEALGALVERGEDGLTIRGTGLRAAAPAAGVIDVGNAGTLMRLLPGWLAGQPGGSWTLDGDESIRRRPVDRIAEPLRRMGARIDAREDRFAPFTVTGSPLRGDRVRAAGRLRADQVLRAARRAAGRAARPR